ncbi:MAG: AAA family ATPase [Treponema sp.]|jgi:MoxR-like ATPase|nr:AAA family ATPase [Treponema sp.]
MPIKPKINALLKQLREGIYEKEEILALALLSSVAGESIFLLGPPGVAKSLIARRLKYAYKDGKAFEYLMSHFSTPDEIFGPVSISKLKEEDKYERITGSYLPGASAVFLDEIWKAGPSIQNALLTVLNEKVYRNGEQEIRLPMKALIAASNELPLKGQGLEALWDRFLVRIAVGGIADMQNFKAMISHPLSSPEDGVADPVDEKNKITDEEYKTWSKRIDSIIIPENIFNVIVLIKTRYIEAYNTQEENAKKQIYISDRRWRKIVRLLRTSAFLNDRKAVDLMDCFLISHCIWNDREEIETVFRFVHEAIQKYGYTADFDRAGFREELEELQREIVQETRTIQDTRKTILKLCNQDYYGIIYNEQHTYYIKQTDYTALTDSDKSVGLYSRHHVSSGYLERNRSSILKQGGSGFNMTFDGATCDLETLFKYSHIARIRKSSDPFAIIIDGKEYKLETIGTGDRRRITRKPGETAAAAWDKRTAGFLAYTDERKARIEQYQKQDAKYFKGNLFVKPELAALVEFQLAAARKEIDKLEVEIREIQHRYRRLQDEEVLLE